MMEIQQEMSATVNDFILRRVNTLNAEHLPPKLVQVVCCNLTGEYHIGSRSAGMHSMHNLILPWSNFHRDSAEHVRTSL